MRLVPYSIRSKYKQLQWYLQKRKFVQTFGPDMSDHDDGISVDIDSEPFTLAIRSWQKERDALQKDYQQLVFDLVEIRCVQACIARRMSDTFLWRLTGISSFWDTDRPDPDAGLSLKLVTEPEPLLWENQPRRIPLIYLKQLTTLRHRAEVWSKGLTTILEASGEKVIRKVLCEARPLLPIVKA